MYVATYPVQMVETTCHVHTRVDVSLLIIRFMSLVTNVCIEGACDRLRFPSLPSAQRAFELRETRWLHPERTLVIPFRDTRERYRWDRRR